VIDAPSPYAEIEREKPQHQLYRNLRAELARHRELRERGGWSPVPPGATLRLGDRDPRVAALRARLAATGELAPDAAVGGDVYDDALEAAVREYQTRNGLDADGVVGRRTLASLNRSIDDRISQIAVNLERGRWLLHDLDPTFVVVNVAGFRAYYLRDEALVWSARVQVGLPYRQTPMFRSRLGYLVLNPTWTVPPVIFANDVLPALKRDPDYLEKHSMRVVDTEGLPVPEPVDWANVGPDGFPYLLRRDPGPGNPLGRVKFMFPNPYAVYLHDTPSQALFEKADRTESSGCIRIENALELAALLLEGQEGWDAAALELAVATGETRTVTLERRVPVLVSYWTAWVDRDGKLQVRSDVYGLDAKVRAGLDTPFHPPVLRRLQAPRSEARASPAQSR
jgi:murein L,D-transpeptidase YcbB/YkuD